MADAAAARREARRRRILENSQDRLQRITGKSDVLVPDSEVSPFPHIQKTLTEPISFATEDFALSSETISDLSFYEPNDITSPVRPQTQNIPPTACDEIGTSKYFKRIMQTKIDIVLVSLTFQIYLIFFHRFSFNLFLPVLVHGIAKFYFFNGSDQQGILRAMLVMNGISPVKVDRIMKIKHFISSLVQDCCILLFITVCFQGLCVMLKEIIL